MISAIVFWTLCVLTLGTFFWLVWDISHWIVEDLAKPLD